MEFIEAGAFSKHVYEYLSDDEIWLLTIYSKSETENIPAHVLRQIAKEIDDVR